MRRLLSLLLVASTIASAQEAKNTPPVITTTTRLVQVDIVVSDKSGVPIKGLQASDFTVLQDGKPQQVSFFDAHQLSGSEPNEIAATEKLPSNVFSNQPKHASSSSWTIILFDLLNTPVADQMNARKQLINLIHSLPAGHPV